jgi:glutathione S-transferase
MPISLYGSQISTFARKIAVVLDLKELAFEHIDALTPQMHDELRLVNPRIEVPVLVDDDIVVVNSSDIIQYLDQRYPERPLLPDRIGERVVARAFERVADQRFDAIVVDCSYWHWADRDDAPPEGLLKAAQQDIDALFDRLERTLQARPRPWPFSGPGSAGMRLVSQPRCDANFRPIDRRRAISRSRRLVQSDSHPSGLCRRRAENRCLPEGPSTPFARAAAVVLERRSYGMVDIARISPLVPCRDRSGPCGVSRIATSVRDDTKSASRAAKTCWKGGFGQPEWSDSSFADEC